MTNIHSAVTPAARRSARADRRMLTRAVVSFLLILSMAAAWAIPALAETVYPKATDRIADDAAILSESTVREIKEKNETLISEVQACIAVCTVKTTNGVDIGKYARSVYTEWKLPTGVLLLIASEDNAFYLVQSASISDKITNEDLEGIRDREIEEDFAAGNVDRAVRKAVSQLSILMLKELKADAEENAAGTEAEAAADANKDTSAESGSKTSAGSVIVKILKALLVVVLVIAAAFILLFIAALFNDNVADFMRTYIFRRGKQDSSASSYYDDRLYNDPRNRGQNRTRPQGQNAPRQGQYPVQYTGQVPNQQQYPQYPNRQYVRNPGQQQYPQYPNQQYVHNPGQQQYPQYPNQQYVQNPGQQQYPQQYPNQQYAQNQGQQYRQVPNQQQPYTAQYPGQQRQAAPGAARRQAAPAQSQPYSAETDPNLIARRQAQGGDPTATQTYSIPGRGGY